MKHRYILLKDSDGYENLWKIIHETSVAYIINRCEDTSVVLKDTCFTKGGSIFYSNAIRDFNLVSYEESDESYLKYLGKDIFEPYYPNEEEQIDYCNSYIDMDDEGNLYEILSLDYLKELEYNMCDAEYQKWLSGEDE